MADVIFDRGRAVFPGALDWPNSTIKVLLAQTAYAINIAHNTVSQVTNELVGGGYARQTIANRTISQGSGLATLLADMTPFTGISLAGAGAVFRWAIVFRFVTNDADSDLLVAKDLTAADLTGFSGVNIKWNSGATNGAIFTV